MGPHYPPIPGPSMPGSVLMTPGLWEDPDRWQLACRQGLSAQEGGWWQNVLVQERGDHLNPASPLPGAPPGSLCMQQAQGGRWHPAGAASQETAPVSPAFKTLFGYSDVTTCACPRGCLHAFPWANEPDLGREPPWGGEESPGQPWVRLGEPATDRRTGLWAVELSSSFSVQSQRGRTKGVWFGGPLRWVGMDLRGDR